MGLIPAVTHRLAHWPGCDETGEVHNTRRDTARLTYSMRTSRFGLTWAFIAASCDGCARKAQVRELVRLAAENYGRTGRGVYPVCTGPVPGWSTANDTDGHREEITDLAGVLP